MSKSQQIKQLQDVHRVGPPPFLWGRIQRAVKHQQHKLPRQWVVAACIGFALLLVSNVIYLAPSLTSASSEMERGLNQLFDITPSNQLYDE